MANRIHLVSKLEKLQKKMNSSENSVTNQMVKYKSQWYIIISGYNINELC